MARRPEVILELPGRRLTAAEVTALRADWQRLQVLPAVREDRVLVIGAEHALVPGPRLPLLYRELRRALQVAAAGGS